MTTYVVRTRIALMDVDLEMLKKHWFFIGFRSENV